MATAQAVHPFTAIQGYFEEARRPAYINRVKSPSQLLNEAAADFRAAFYKAHGNDALGEAFDHIKALDAAAKDAARFWKHFSHMDVGFLTDAVDSAFDHFVGSSLAPAAGGYFNAAVAYELAMLAQQEAA